ncbi:hypothetical protein, partial [Plasticicumulans sp.]|uniref:hypothetical protein n=1 Tax=Plasticicumulans sp. TaxID=2307179 RepID=UPI00321F8993
DDIAAAAGRARNASDVLDEQDLSGLSSALDAARQKLLEIDEQAAATARSVRDALLQERGDQAAIEASRFAEQQQQLKDQLKAAEAARSTAAEAELRQALRDAEEIHRLKSRKIDEQAKQQAARDAETAERQRQQAQQAQQSQQGSGRPSGGGPTFNVSLAGTGVSLRNVPQGGNEDALAKIAAAKRAAR